jgi:DNA-binding MarR family transcriptional regulator
MQRAARALARYFDEALKPAGVTNGQFSLLMSLNRPQPATMGQIATTLAMDRTTLTAALKPLERRGLVEVTVDDEDKRSRRLSLTMAGRAVLTAALPLWISSHSEVEDEMGDDGANRLRGDLTALAKK